MCSPDGSPQRSPCTPRNKWDPKRTKECETLLDQLGNYGEKKESYTNHNAFVLLYAST